MSVSTRNAVSETDTHLDVKLVGVLRLRQILEYLT